MAETNCAKWRRESVPVGLRVKVSLVRAVDAQLAQEIRINLVPRRWFVRVRLAIYHLDRIRFISATGSFTLPNSARNKILTRRAHAAATTSRHVSMADAPKARCEMTLDVEGCPASAPMRQF
jgi:hypothetical protein